MLAIEFLFAAAVLFYFYNIKAAVVIGVMLAVFVYYRYKSYKEFGGITGDIAGWFLCLCEMAGTIACAFI